MSNYFNIPNAVDNAFRRLSDADRGIAYALYADYRRFGTLPDFDSLSDMLYLALKYAVSITPKRRRKKDAEQPEAQTSQLEASKASETAPSEPIPSEEEKEQQSLDQLENLVDRINNMSKSDKIDAKEALDLIGEAMKYISDHPEDEAFDDEFDDDFEEDDAPQQSLLAS